MNKERRLKSFIERAKIRSVERIFDDLGFIQILSIWALVVVIFGFVYTFFTSETSFLLHNAQQTVVYDVFETIYFSFITATTTGFGDIIPYGGFKLVAILEVISGLLLLAVVTSKLVSIKQNVILSEIYEISLYEKVNRLRSSLLLFRQNISKLVSKVEENTIRKREINDAYVYISALEDVLNEVVSLFGKSGKHQFTKEIDSVNTQLIVNSITSSLERLDELLDLMNQRKLEWRRDVTLDLISECLRLNSDIFNRVQSSKNMMEKTFADLQAQNEKVVASLKQNIKPPADKPTSLASFITMMEQKEGKDPVASEEKKRVKKS